MLKRSFYSYTYAELCEIAQSQNLGIHAPRLVYNWHYKKFKTEALTHQDLSLRAKDYFYNQCDFSLPQVDKTQLSEDRTVKFLMTLKDQLSIETVLIPFQGKYTLCLSSQVGCAMKCSFCFTGTQGLKRNLATEEIIGQFIQAKLWLQQNRPSDQNILNVVFMGQGEPLHNFESVRDACYILTSQFGLSLAVHKITISTSGYLPGLLKFKQEMPPVNIALSLHAVTDELRSELIPINKKYPLKELLPFLDAIPEGKNRFITYEYILISELNDFDSDAHKLGETLKNKKAYINLIPFNPIPGSNYRRPSEERIKLFRSIVESYSIPTTLRTTKGDQILAACGQLNTKVKTSLV